MKKLVGVAPMKHIMFYLMNELDPSLGPIHPNHLNIYFLPDLTAKYGFNKVIPTTLSLSNYLPTATHVAFYLTIIFPFGSLEAISSWGQNLHRPRGKWEMGPTAL